MNFKLIFFVLGTILIVFSLVLIMPLFVSLGFSDDGNIYKQQEYSAFIFTILVTLLFGVALRIVFKKSRQTELGIRDGFGIVFCSWVILALFGCLPFYLSSAIPSFTDAYFETMSGLTTTGSTILTKVEILPHGLLFWRCFTQFLGGMGIIVLALAVLPALGIGGYHLFKLEAPGGSTSAKIKPRFMEVARTLWSIYLLLVLVLILLLKLGGMSLFESVCHSFTTVSTGGFSTRTESIGGFANSTYISYVIVIFMFIAACSFRLHYNILRGRFIEILKDPQLKYFVLITLVAIAFTTFIHLSYQTPEASSNEAVRHSSFQVVSLITSTGYTTTDFNKWPEVGKFILLILMLMGGCAGSTTGAIKQIRLVILAKVAWRELVQLIRPRQVMAIKVNDTLIERQMISNILGFLLFYLLTIVVSTFILTALGLNLTSSVTGVISAIGNMGPALDSVSANYSMVPVLGKWVLAFCMLAGRLEMFGLWILLSPATWKK